MIRRLLIILLFSVPCFAQTPTVINFDSAGAVISDSGVPIFPKGALSTPVKMCVAVGTNCATGTLTVGHTYYPWAYRSGSTTAPGAFSGVTNTTLNAAAGGNAQSQRAACWVATTTSTVTPTSANATDMGVFDLGVTASGATSNCNTTGFGSVKLTTGASGANASYGTIPSFSVQDSTSFVLFGGGAPSATSMTAPSGTTLITGGSVGSAPMISVYGSNNALNSWSATNGAISPNSTWLTFGTEVIAPGLIENRLVRKTVSGNAIACMVSYSVKSPVITPVVTDDGSNTYTNPFAWDDGNNVMSIWIALNVAANTTKVTFTFNDPVNSSGFFSNCIQLDNVATSSAVDGNPAGGGAATGTTLQADGSCFHAIVGVCQNGLSTSSDGDIVISWGVNNGDCSAAGPPNYDQFSSAGSGVLLSHDPTTKMAVETQIQTTHGVLTPSMTQTCNANWLFSSIALKKATSGGGYSGININSSTTIALESLTLNTSPAHTLALKFPSSGNLLVLAFQLQNSAASEAPTAVTSTNPSCTWAGGDHFDTGAGNDEIWYCANTTGTASTTVTITFPSGLTSITGSTVVMYDISGAAASPYDSTACANTATCTTTSSQGAGGDLTVTSIITPSTANGLVLGQLQVLSSNAYGATSPSGVLNASPDQNNVWSLFYNPSSAAETYVFHTNQVALSSWGMQAVAFEAPASTSPSMPFSIY